jgi:hypothetical protein
MPRVRKEIDSRYLKELPRDAELLDCTEFLRAVRQIRSGDNWSFRDGKSSRSGAYGFTEAEWKMVAGEHKHFTAKESIEHIAYRWFLHCWHEILLAGLLVSAQSVAVLWEKGPGLGIRDLKRGHFTRFAFKVGLEYEREI